MEANYKCDGVDWVQLAQDRILLYGSCEYGNEPLCSINREFVNKLRDRKNPAL